MQTGAAPKQAPLELAGRRVVVLGLGRSGRAAAELLQGRGALEERVDEGPGAAALYAGEWAQQTLREGHAQSHPALLEAAALLVLSPGVPTTHPLVRAAMARGIPVRGELELAHRCIGAPVIAVTGSKGKSTTTALVGALLEGAGVENVVAGNIGLPYSALAARLGPGAWAVLEVSSFQLESVEHFHARAAVLLKISPDHLDRYASMDDYAAAKARIVCNQTAADLFVVDPDDPYAATLASRGPARVAGFRVAWRGTGVERDADALVWREAGRRDVLCRVDDVPLLGEHNLHNAMAALAVVRGLGLWNDGARAALRRFTGLEFRMQPCGDLGGIRCINDSKSTTVESVRAAVRGLPGPLLLALGGRNKGLDFTPLRAELGKVKVVLLFGEAAGEIGAQLEGAAPLDRVADLDALLRRARQLGRAGDTLLFSPGCTSFDMFANAEARGHAFAAAVARAQHEEAG